MGRRVVLRGLGLWLMGRRSIRRVKGGFLWIRCYGVKEFCSLVIAFISLGVLSLF